MKIKSLNHISGPNVYHNKPVLVITLDLENLKDTSSLAIPNFIPNLLKLLPGLQDHHCSPGRPGGFVERLHRGTYFAHIIEHVILELSTPVGIPVNYGKSIYGGSDGVYKIIVRSKSEEGMKKLSRIAIELIETLIQGKSYSNLQDRLEEVKQLISHTELGPSTKAIVEAAIKRGIPYSRLNDQSFIQFGYGKNRKLIEAALSNQTSSMAVAIAQDKSLTKEILSKASIPVPYGKKVYDFEEALETFNELKCAVAVKPADSNQGKGITLNVQNETELKRAFEIALSFSNSILIEECLKGKDYRVLVVDGKIVAASERLPAHVTGNGINNLQELIEIENQNPLRGEGHEKPLTKLEITESTLIFLSQRNLKLTSIPQYGEKIFLNQMANLSKGGIARDVTDEVHPEIKSLCERVSRMIDLDICGIDLILNDISTPLAKTGNGVIEVNASPGLRMHIHPSEGKSRDVGKAIVDMLYPAGKDSRIPIISITGTNGKTTVTRMIGHILSHSGIQVGMTSTDGIHIGGVRVAEGDTTGPQSAKTVLNDPSVEMAVLETARGGIVRRGLGYDLSDVGVITNIQPDHFGQDGIESIEDIIKIKSLIAERVKENGILVLNADDEEISKLIEIPRIAKTPKKIVYFSLRSNYLKIKRHIDNGGTAYIIENDEIVEVTWNKKLTIAHISQIPATVQGTALFQIANSLAAIAACRAVGCLAQEIANGLASFQPGNNNPGRMNLYQVGKGYLIADYGHNPKAFEAICSMVAHWRNQNKLTAILGLPGDRSNDLIESSAKIVAQGFDKILIREDEDLRGRKPGEIAELIFKTMKETENQLDCQIVLDELQAIEKAVEEMEENEIITLFYDDPQSLKNCLEKMNAIPISSLPVFDHSPLSSKRKAI